MVDNRYATALVIGSVLSLLATVYLCVAAGTQHWYQYNSPVAHELVNVSKEEFITGDNEKTYVEAMFGLNGTQGLWWRCILVQGTCFCTNTLLHLKKKTKLTSIEFLKILVLFEKGLRDETPRNDLSVMIMAVCICGSRCEAGVCELQSAAAV